MEIGGGETGLGPSTEDVDVGDTAVEGERFTMRLGLVDIHRLILLHLLRAPSLLRLVAVLAHRSLPRRTWNG